MAAPTPVEAVAITISFSPPNEEALKVSSIGLLFNRWPAFYLQALKFFFQGNIFIP